MKRIICAAAALLTLLSTAGCAGSGAGAGAAPDKTVPAAAGTETPKASSSDTPSPSETESADALPAPKLTLIGHASFKIKTSEGKVVYIDPYYEGDYGEGADLILVTHGHSDHNKTGLCARNEGCVVLTHKENINKDGSFNVYDAGWMTVEPVAAYNGNHPKGTGSGFVLSFDGITVYIAGDTSKIGEMAALNAKNIDYAFFPIDGKYNMGPAEAAECAAVVGAKHNTPVHFFDADPEDFRPENLLKMAYGETIELIRQ